MTTQALSLSDTHTHVHTQVLQHLLNQDAAVIGYFANFKKNQSLSCFTKLGFMMSKFSTAVNHKYESRKSPDFEMP